MDILSKEELTTLLNTPRIPNVIFRYSRYQFGATLEFLKQCDNKYSLQIMDSEEMKEAIEKLYSELSKDDNSEFTFDKRSKDAKENAENNNVSIDILFDKFEDLQEQGLGDKTEEGQELRGLIRSFIEQEHLAIRITRSTSNQELLDTIEDAMQGGDKTPKDNQAKVIEETTYEEQSFEETNNEEEAKPRTVRERRIRE